MPSFQSALRGPFNSLLLRPFSASGLSVGAYGTKVHYCFYLHFYGLIQVRYSIFKIYGLRIFLKVSFVNTYFLR